VDPGVAGERVAEEISGLRRSRMQKEKKFKIPEHERVVMDRLPE
jgi:hypothetical protein